MALQAVSLPSQITGAKGQFRTSTCQFVSDTVLTGQLINFNPGLWLSGSGDIPDNNAWQIVYPAAAGQYDMDFVAADLFRNFKAVIRVIDNKTFTITLNYFLVSDLNDYTGDTAPNNGLIFNDSYGTYQSIYNGVKKLVFYVSTGDGSSATCEISTQATGFCTQASISFRYLDPNGAETLGYTLGQNLTVEITSALSSISNNFFVGFYREDQVANGVNFVTDLGLNYGRVTSGVSSVHPDVPVTCFAGGQGFVSDGTTSSASVELDSSCFQDNGSYRLYIIYVQNGVTYSCRTESIIQGGSGRNPIIPNIACSVEDDFGNSYTDCCVNGLVYCTPLTARLTIDRASYEAALVTEGLTGTLEDYFQSVSVFQTNELPDDITAARNIGVPNVTTSFGASGIMSTVNDYAVQDGFSGTVYLVFCFLFDYGSPLTGSDTDTIYGVIRLGYAASSGSITPVFTDNSGLVQDIICAETTTSLTATDPLIGSACIPFVSEGGLLFQQGSDIITSVNAGSIDFDPSEMTLDTEYCVKLVCYTPGGSSDPCDECPDITLTITAAIRDCSPTSNCLIDLDWAFSDLPAAVTTIQYIGTLGGDSSGSACFYVGPDTAFTCVVPTGVNSGNFFIQYAFIVTLNNGCQYTVANTLTGISSSGFPQVGDQLSITPSNCPTPIPNPDCDTNLAWIDFTCDPENEIITISTADSLTSPVDTDDFLCSTDGINYSPCVAAYNNEPKLFAQRNITFTDGCPPVNVEQVIDCIPQLICQNTIEVECDLQPTLLTLTTNDNINSPIAQDSFLVSIDGGMTFGPYVAPIMLVGGETIIITRTVTFSDGCPSVSITPITKVNGVQANCDYSQYDLTCTYDEATMLFTATFIGDQGLLATNIQEYSLDGGTTYMPYTVPVTGTLFLVRWTLAFAGCDTQILVKACCRPEQSILDPDGCLPIIIKEIQDDINVVITDIQDCVDICPPDCAPFDPGPGGGFFAGC